MTPRTVTSPCKVRVEESNQGYLSFLPYDGTVYRVDAWLVVTVFAWLLSRLFFFTCSSGCCGCIGNPHDGIR
nr:MAG TPA: FeoB-associated Cys-rich membrane protein [Inoviridae sp.]